MKGRSLCVSDGVGLYLRMTWAMPTPFYLPVGSLYFFSNRAYSQARFRAGDSTLPASGDKPNSNC